MTATRAPRPTQRQRRERTVGLILDATISALSDLGYSRASVTEIGRRAGVSQGGMFRHFDTRLDMIVAAAEAVCERQLATFALDLEATDGSVHDLLTLTREASRDPINAAWRELLAAARCDEDLRARLGPTVEVYYARIVELARSQPALSAIPDEHLTSVVLTVLHAFDGDALARAAHPAPGLDDQLLAILEVMFQGLLRTLPG